MAKTRSNRKKKGPSPKRKDVLEAEYVEEYHPPASTPLHIVVAAIGSIVTGLVVIILSFLELLPSAPQPQYNLVGLVFMCIGFVFATQIK